MSDGLGDGLVIECCSEDLEFLRVTSFGMLQGCRMRNIKTEYVSCPSCGRTLFDLQEVTESIRVRTGHLPGVSIAVMGCIVNGPGEMADADFGYVGGAPGKIDLYVGKEVVRRAIDMEGATDALIELIKVNGYQWGRCIGWWGVCPVQVCVVNGHHPFYTLPPTNCSVGLMQEHGRWQDPPKEEEESAEQMAVVA
jgi:4-hydroxy-3-methylbut-2-en-1-yl diphosphate synthase IspG/GcpE